MIGDYLPFWEKLGKAEQEKLEGCAKKQTIKKGTLVAGEHRECTGILVVTKGQLRVFVLSEEGKEITLFRLLERDFCLFSASCTMNGLTFEVMIEAMEETEVYRIPPEVYKQLREQSLAISNYTSEVMASRFSDVMWLLDQILNKRLDSRLAALLLEESSLAASEVITVTHEQLGNHLGSPREVITRMLRHFQKEQLIGMSRGKIELLDAEGLTALAEDSIR